MTGNIIVYGTVLNDSDLRSLALIDQFQNGQIDHLVYVTTTTNSDSHWITVLVRRDQHNQVELVVTDSLGRDRSNEENVQAIYNQFVGGNNQKAQKRSSSNLSSKNKEKKNEQASSSSFSQAGVSPSCGNKQNIKIKSFINDEGIEEFIIPEDDVEEYQEPKSKDTKKRKRNLIEFAKDKKMKLSERASRPRRKAFVKAKDSLKKMYASGRRKRKKKRDGLHARSHRRSSSRNQSKSNQQESVMQAGPEEPGGSDSSDDESDGKPSKKPKRAKKDDTNWTSHRYKHFPQKNMSWKNVVKSTKNGPAKYKHEINVEKFERMAWEKGKPVTNGRPFKVFKADDIIGASSGKETPYVRVEISSNTIHGHPITQSEYIRYLK